MKRHRFKVDDLGGELIEVGGAEAHHALSVLRCKRGDEILLFDGQGAEATAVIEQVSGQLFSARVVSRRARAGVAARLTIATAIPKGERADWMIEKCAELGVARIIPLVTQRGEVKPGEGKIERWRKKVDAAAKQSGQTMLMEIELPIELEGFLAASSGVPLAYGDLGGERTLPEWLGSRENPESWTFLVGPEGGFSENEGRMIADAGGVGLRLGPGTLRIETAAVAVAALAHAMGG